MRCVYLEIIEEISLPKPPFVPMLLASTQATGQYFSYMQPLFDEFGGKFGFSEVFLGQYGKYYGWTEIFISFAMVRYSPKGAFEAFGFPWEAANRLLRNLLPVIGNKFLTNSFSSAFQ